MSPKSRPRGRQRASKEAISRVSMGGKEVVATPIRCANSSQLRRVEEVKLRAMPTDRDVATLPQRPRARTGTAFQNANQGSTARRQGSVAQCPANHIFEKCLKMSAR